MKTVHRQSYNSDLTDSQWERIKSILPRPAKTGRKPRNTREAINGILYVLSTGCRWKDMPHDIDTSPSTANRWLLDFQKRRVWQNIQQELMKEACRRDEINLNNSYHDASVIKSKRGRNMR